MRDKSKPSYLEERIRCLRLVEAYRDRVEGILADPRWTKPVHVSWRAVAEKVAEALRGIEREIKHPEDRKGSEFSIEELEMAEAIMAEQNKNPFEG